MNILEWAILGALMLGIVIFCARVMRRGLTTLDEDRKQYLEKIRQGERQIAEDRKNMGAHEHLLIMRTALEDLIRLEGNPAGYEVRPRQHALEFVTPEGSWHVELVMRERHLKSSHRVLHGKSRWLLKGFGHFEEYPDPAPLMHSLTEHLHSGHKDEAEPEHIARRIGALHASRKILGIQKM